MVADQRGKMVMLPEHHVGVAVLTNASTVIGEAKSHIIANGVAAMMAGKHPSRTGWPLGRLYLLVAVGMLVLALDLGKEALKLRTWRAQAAELAGDRRALVRQIVLPTLWGLLAPAALLIGLPLLLQLSWVEMIRHLPDVSWFLLGYCPLAIALSLARIWLARHTRWR